MLKSLQSRIILFFSIIILISGLAMSYMMYTSSQQLVVEALGKQALSLAKSAADEIDAAQYEQIAQNLEMNAAYTDMQQKLYQLKQSNGLKYLYTMSMTEDGKVYYVVDGSTLDMESDNFSALGDFEEELDDLTLRAYETKQPQLGSLDYSDAYGATMSAYYPILKSDGAILGVVGADFDATEIYEVMARNRTTTIIIVSATVVLSIVLIYIVAKLLLRPLRMLLHSIKQVQEGDLTVQLERKGSSEIAVLAEGFSDLTTDLRATLTRLSDSHAVIKSSIATLTDNVASADELGDKLSRHIVFADKQLAVQHQASHETTAAMNEVAEGMRHVAAASEQMFNVASRATLLSTSGNSSLNQLQQQMEAIQHSTAKASQDIISLQNLSQDVQEMVVMIKRIASQTGMLALNASIEASRAGEQGKGFNVVAQEVRKLADQTDLAANQVEELIGRMLHLTESAGSASQTSSEDVVSGTTAAASTGEVFGSISEEIAQVEQQAHHLSSTSSQISATIQGLNEMTEQAAQLSEEAVAATSEMKQTADVQTQSVQQMKQLVHELNEQAIELESVLLRFKL